MMWQRNISALSEKANYQMDDEITLVDASGLKCPLPVLKARKALQSLTDGDKLRVISTDPASPLDFKHFCNSKGHSLLSVEEKEESFEFMILKSCGG